jgi:hypothetical protein
MSMEITGTDYTGWKRGKCWTIASKFFGPGADKRNAETVSEMVGQGFEVRELPVAEAVEAHIAAIS